MGERKTWCNERVMFFFMQDAVKSLLEFLSKLNMHMTLRNPNKPNRK